MSFRLSKSASAVGVNLGPHAVGSGYLLDPKFFTTSSKYCWLVLLPVVVVLLLLVVVLHVAVSVLVTFPSCGGAII